MYDLWDSYNAGLVLSPAHARIRCSFSRDGFTYNIFPDGCPDPACTDAGACGVFYCGSIADEFWWKCGWRPTQVRTQGLSHPGLALCSDLSSVLEPSRGQLASMMSMHERLRAGHADHSNYNELVRTCKGSLTLPD